MVKPIKITLHLLVIQPFFGGNWDRGHGYLSDITFCTTPPPPNANLSVEMNYFPSALPGITQERCVIPKRWRHQTHLYIKSVLQPLTTNSTQEMHRSTQQDDWHSHPETCSQDSYSPSILHVTLYWATPPRTLWEINCHIAKTILSSTGTVLTTTFNSKDAS